MLKKVNTIKLPKSDREQLNNDASFKLFFAVELPLSIFYLQNRRITPRLTPMKPP